jgi:CBS domain-containing protein
VIQVSAAHPVVEDTEYLKLVGVVTGGDVCFGMATYDRCASEVRVEKVVRVLSVCCGGNETVEGARRKLYAYRAASLPVADKAGDYL